MSPPPGLLLYNLWKPTGELSRDAGGRLPQYPSPHFFLCVLPHQSICLSPCSLIFLWPSHPISIYVFLLHPFFSLFLSLPSPLSFHSVFVCISL